MLCHPCECVNNNNYHKMRGIKITKNILKMIALVAITQDYLIVLTEGQICIWCHLILLPFRGYKSSCCITCWSIFCRLHSSWQEHHPLFHRQVSWCLPQIDNSNRELSLAMISSIINSTFKNRNNSESLFNPLVEIILRIYKLNFIIIFDPLFRIIGIIFSECWADVNDVVKMFVIFIFNIFVWPMNMLVWGFLI